MLLLTQVNTGFEMYSPNILRQLISHFTVVPAFGCRPERTYGKIQVQV